MGLFNFGGKKTLPAAEMKKVMDQLAADLKTSTRDMSSLFHVVAGAMGKCGYKALPDSPLVESGVRQIRTYGMPKDLASTGKETADWWKTATPEARQKAIESVSECLK